MAAREKCQSLHEVRWGLCSCCWLCRGGAQTGHGEQREKPGGEGELLFLLAACTLLIFKRLVAHKT